VEGSGGTIVKSDMKDIDRQNQSDLWWLTSEEAKRYKYVYLCYQEPYSDEPDSDKNPTSVNRYFSLGVNGELLTDKQYYPWNS
jgi:hypothetical protein